MTTSAALEQAYTLCARLTHQRGANFSIGFRYLPNVKRRAVYAAYAFCRLADDLVDEAEGSSSEPVLQAALARWRQELRRTYDGIPQHPVGLALADALRRFPIPREAFEGLIDGCHLDVIGATYRTFADLLTEYCDRVAATIGRISLAIFGVRHPEAEQLGRQLSMALQMTNILRDVREDAQRGRVYLPLEELESHGVRIEDLARGRGCRGFTELMSLNVARTQRFYEDALPLPSKVESDASLATALMAGVYWRILQRIAEDPLRVLRERIELEEEEKCELIRAEMRRWSPPSTEVV